MDNFPDEGLQDPEGFQSLEGYLLIAMPGIGDRRFHRCVIYICSHKENGAVGFIVNRPAREISFAELLSQLDILSDDEALPAMVPVHIGGPVEAERGFVIHSTDFTSTDSTLYITDIIGVTATLDILSAIAQDIGPEQKIVVLGYAGWGPGQLEEELQMNVWLHCPASMDILFHPDADQKYDMALNSMGVSSARLSMDFGQA